MRLFLDASVLLASAGSANGASRAIFPYAAAQKWSLIINVPCIKLDEFMATEGWSF